MGVVILQAFVVVALFSVIAFACCFAVLYRYEDEFNDSLFLDIATAQVDGHHERDVNSS